MFPRAGVARYNCLAGGKPQCISQELIYFGRHPTPQIIIIMTSLANHLFTALTGGFLFI